LKTLLIPGYYEDSAYTDNAAAVIAGVLRLSTKYDVQYLRRRSITMIRPLYPTTIVKFDERRGRPAPVDFLNDEIFTLARDCNLPNAFLPAAMYYHLLCHYTQTFMGIRLQPKVDCITHGVDDCVTHGVDAKVCMVVRYRTAETWRRVALAPIIGDLPVEGCLSREKCVASGLRWLLHPKVKSVVFGSNWCMPLDKLPYSLLDEYTKVVCDKCKAASTASFRDARQAVWNELPGFLDLPDWKKLRVELEASLEREG